MANQYVNKVILRRNNVNEVVIDLTSDTVDASKILKGYTAHDKSGNIIVGTFDMDEYLSLNFRGLYRGKQLGTGSTFAAASTAEQRSAIADGTFKNMFVGDYWLINNVTYRIADFDYWYNTGDTNATRCKTHHVVIVPDTAIYSGYMNSTATVIGGYNNSYMVTNADSALNKSANILTTRFGDYVLSHRDYLAYYNSDGHLSGSWKDRTVDLLNELMIYGAFVQAKPISDTDIRYFQTINNTQLRLFDICPEFIHTATNYWLRDVATTSEFVRVDSSGLSSRAAANSNLAARIVFGVCGTTS